ncbi:MAG TPA: lipoyl domain-containing protein [Anaeromyxobacteraceae bacterium]|nr:lipoyl domain-containing protein [Anaeromyxobacteraceae bacterium]
MAVVRVAVPDVWGEDKSQEGVVVNWFFEPGAKVKEGDVIAEGMVEKVSFEIRAPASGVLARVLAPVDTPIRPGSPLAEIET